MHQSQPLVVFSICCPSLVPSTRTVCTCNFCIYARLLWKLWLLEVELRPGCTWLETRGITIRRELEFSLLPV